MAVTKGTEGSLYIITSTTAFSGEATTEDGATTIYQIDDTDKRVWDPNTEITPSTGTIDRAWQDEGVDWFTGRVKMTATGLTALTLSGDYVTLKVVAEVYAWSLTLERTSENVQTIGESWADPMDLGERATVTLSRFRTDTDFDHVADDDWVLLKLYEDATNGYWAKALRKSMGWTKAVGAVDKEAVEFESSGPIARIA